MGHEVIVAKQEELPLLNAPQEKNNGHDDRTFAFPLPRSQHHPQQHREFLQE
jgi:hypothetical protein